MVLVSHESVEKHDNRFAFFLDRQMRNAPNHDTGLDEVVHHQGPEDQTIPDQQVPAADDLIHQKSFASRCLRGILNPEDGFDLTGGEKMNLLIVGVKGRVLGINKTNGKKAWETHLRSSGFVNVYVEQDLIYASTRGELFCLEPNSGSIVWHNKMKGLGYGMISFGWDPANQAIQAAQIQAQQQAAAAAAGGGAAAAQ